MRSDADRESAGRCALAALAVIAAVALTSCGGSALDNARATLSTTARVAAAADSIAADVIQERIAATESEAELVREERRAARVVRAFVSVHAVLVSADAALDAWQAGSAEEGTWLDAVSCALPAVLALVDALAEYGLPETVTEPLRMATAVLSGFLGGSCGGWRMSIADDIAAEAARLNALDETLDVAGVLMHPDTADALVLSPDLICVLCIDFGCPGAEIILDPTVHRELAIPQSRRELVAWKAKRDALA